VNDVAGVEMFLIFALYNTNTQHDEHQEGNT
jgi:hypothetical protein